MPSGPWHVQDVPERGEGAERRGRDSVQQVVPHHQRETERRDRRARQMNQPSQHHHRGADRPDHLCAGAHGPPGAEIPSKADHRQLEQNQPQPAGEEEAGELAARAAGTGDPCAGPGEKDEDRRAVVGDPAGGEERQVGAGQVGGVEPGIGEVGPDVIQHHDDHDQAAEQVHVVEAGAPGGGLGPCRRGTARPRDPVFSRRGLGSKHCAHVRFSGPGGFGGWMIEVHTVMRDEATQSGQRMTPALSRCELHQRGTGNVRPRNRSAQSFMSRVCEDARATRARPMGLIT